ncbi:motility associated factor glycosyltransferase family protein [Citrifermentans bremense]|uniref:6-hydroxymethylpterin diphosphokinase MptE-like protein n=1 Tax=Citrifermentans bremense TaxID=60035 RepID=UPI0003F4DE68|nr:6-hydroxymethylpterin diphosphokinase MptE-like protein [Citrifermentans bremense]
MTNIDTQRWKQLIVERNRELADRHKGQRCFILATGPSIKHQDLSPLEGETCIAVSNFFVHPLYPVLRPRYHCIAPFHHPLSEDAMQSWMDDLSRHVADLPEVNLIFSISDVVRNMQNDRFSGKQVYFLDNNASLQEVLDHGLDLAEPVFQAQSVSIIALQAALYMGFSEIYLLGCDHDWLLHMYETRHFYDEEKHAFTRVSGKDIEWKDNDVEVECRSYINLWQQYKVLRRLAAAKGVAIYNSTEGGMLDVFPRVALGTLFPAHAPSPQPHLAQGTRA